MSILLLFYTFFKIGLLGFGGGYAMMSMILMECEKFGISALQFADLNALDMLVPGPIAVNAATYVGYLHAGFWGALAATIGVTLPSFLLVLLALYFMRKYRESTVLSGMLLGIKPAAVGLIAAAAFTVASEALRMPGGSISFLLLGVFIVTAVANTGFKVNPILLTLLAGVLGAVFVR